jgi:hypothetical protein
MMKIQSQPTEFRIDPQAWREFARAFADFWRATADAALLAQQFLVIAARLPRG